MTRLSLLPAVVLVAGLAAAAPAFAATPPATGEDYMAACMGASGDNTELCTCKTTEATKLADAEMLGYIVLSLKDTAKFHEMVQKGEVPEKVLSQWGFYVMKSNAICLPPTN